jgi:DNA-binding MarR family transcriptional regulator
MNKIQIIPPSTKFRGKSRAELLRQKQRRQRGKDPPLVMPDGCGACDKKDRCPSAEKLYRLHKYGDYFIKSKQDRAGWLPELDSEKRAMKSVGEAKYYNIKLCVEHEAFASQDYDSEWDRYFKHKRSDPVAEKEHHQRAAAGTEFGTYQKFDDRNTELHGENRFETKENWMFIVEWNLPPYHKHGRKGIREIARELGVTPGYVSREVKKLKEKLKDTIDEVLTPKDKIEKKLILLKYYVEQNTQAEISEMIGKKQNEVQRIIKRYEKKIRETLRKNVVLTYKVKG